jgi:acid stress-induced BolA-like protein IbaG/YrbA
MESEQIKSLIEAGIPGSEVQVQGDGSHFEALVVSEVFEGLNPVKKQQQVYAVLGEHITSGEIHALTIKAYTPAEWEKASKLRIS